MINIEAQKNKFVDSFCKATGIEREFAEKVFSYISFHNSLDGLADYFNNQYIFVHLEEDESFTYYFVGDNSELAFEEVYKLYKEIVGLDK
jgi:hypothetical protein